MKKISIYLVVAFAIFLSACGTSNKIIIPLSKTLPTIKDNYPIVWVGTGESYLYIDGKYQRSKANDYSFEVVQRRYGNSWKSIKNMHRMHPDYDGKAGDREQTMFFGIDFFKKEDKIVSQVNASLGKGTGVSDNEFRKQTIELSINNTSPFTPYNNIRITQFYSYEEGTLAETVELFKLKDGKETPFVKIEERAVIFRPLELENAPTKFKQ